MVIIIGWSSGTEREVFSLIGPKKYDISWKVLENQGWIAQALCTEIRVDMNLEVRMDYATADDRKRYRIAAENPIKFEIIKDLVARHGDDNILVIGMYLSQLERILFQFFGQPHGQGAADIAVLFEPRLFDDDHRFAFGQTGLMKGFPEAALDRLLHLHLAFTSLSSP